MNVQECPFNSIKVEPKLFAQCIVNADTNVSVPSALALGSTSKIYNTIINSSPFFLGFVELINPKHPFFLFMKESQSGKDDFRKEEKSFRHRYLKLRNIYLQKTEFFPGIRFGDALVSKGGVEIISFDDKISSSMLKEDPLEKSIQIPENLKILPRAVYKSPLAARSEKYLAINQRCDSAIYLYTPDGKNCLAKYEVDGSIDQLMIIGDLLCIVEKDEEGSRQLVAFDLENTQQQDPTRIGLPKNDVLWPPPKPICFGEEYIVYTQSLVEGYKIYALPLSCLKTADVLPLPWIKGTHTKYVRYMLPNGNHFIEVTFKKCYICDISRVIITKKRFLKTKIAKNIRISKNETTWLADICLNNDRVFLAYDNFRCGTSIFCYDIVSKKVTELLHTPHTANSSSFQPQFLNVATTIYYLFMGSFLSDEENKSIERCLQSRLTTFTYG